MSSSNPEIALIGGGTGSFTLLQEIKHVTPNLTAIVNMSDDGGSTGRLRRQYGISPPGDARQCLVALSNSPEMQDLFSYRFGAGDLAGHPVGNVVLAALEQQHEGNIEAAIEAASSMLDITGEVVPATLQKHELVMHDGEETIRSEYEIGRRKIEYLDAYVELEPAAEINPRAKIAIEGADLIVVAPGNLYGSLLPALAVDGMAEAFATSNAKKVVVTNLMNKPFQTDGWHVADYVREIERYIGEEQIDAAVYNNQQPLAELKERYAEACEHPVCSDEKGFRAATFKAIGRPLIASEIVLQNMHDTIARTLIRHDAKAIAAELIKLT